MSRFARIANQRIYQQIVDQISRMIRDGSLRPGDRLPPERQLAEEFGVSRAAVREALSALDLMGLIEVRQGEGTFVRAVTEEALVTPMALLVAMVRDEELGVDMVEVRAALEAEAAYLAAQRREPEDLVAMEEAIAEMEAALRTGDLAAEADWKFHHAIATASGNGVLLQIMRSLSETMQESIVRFRTGLLRIPGMDTVLLAEHQGILDAIRDRDAKLAHDRMRAHLDRVRQMLYGELSATANEQQR
ncbi:GntR family transcriptional repressor for pyruvate dehydrogenase complex [Symbiobacterium terraclitae]|uniref:GntR family transcriptional repressor for pyruvate dehydrogenase complex n=1 Tax=Symbiobacterium terraclitae TaxID=557451 RepID=A0ABS4JYV4_9FIRM|nr:GntR family transcriptional repressor for pyruvate dehydrogenase complex [Symbiobacterium terraclitae]